MKSSCIKGAGGCLRVSRHMTRARTSQLKSYGASPSEDSVVADVVQVLLTASLLLMVILIILLGVVLLLMLSIT